MNGCKVAEAVAKAAAQPLAQIGFLIFCAAWFVFRLPVEILTNLLSILAISLTQMVLLSQDRITTAEHMKLDALIAGTDADDNVAGIEKDG